MASKTIEDILKSMPPQSRAAIEKMSPETRNAVQQTGQGLQKQGIAEKSEHQEAGRRATQTRTTEPKLDNTVFPNQSQRGAQKIEQARTEIQNKSVEPGQAQEKSAQTQDKDR